MNRSELKEMPEIKIKLEAIAIALILWRAMAQGYPQRLWCSGMKIKRGNRSVEHQYASLYLYNTLCISSSLLYFTSRKYFFSLRFVHVWVSKEDCDIYM